jgi:hypothetical protein
MAERDGYPIVRSVFILLLALVLAGDLAMLMKMGADVLGHPS